MEVRVEEVCEARERHVLDWFPVQWCREFGLPRDSVGDVPDPFAVEYLGDVESIVPVEVAEEFVQEVGW